MEWSDFFDGLAKKAAPFLTAQKYEWEWKGDTFHIQSNFDDTFYMEFTLPKPSDYKMTVTMAGYCKLVSYTVQSSPGNEFMKKLLQGKIIAATKMLWRVGSEKGARDLWNYFNDAFKPKTPWLQPDE